MKALPVLLAALIAVPATPSFAAAADEQQAQQKKQKMVCQRVKMTGTRLTMKRVCKPLSGDDVVAEGQESLSTAAGLDQASPLATSASPR